MGMFDSVKSLFKNKNYMFMFTSFSFLYGLYCAISGVISSFTTTYKYDTQDISVICLIFSVAGILNSFFLGTLLDKYQCYRKALIGLCCTSILTLSLSALGLPTGNVAVEGGIMMFTGASLIPVVTVCFSFAAELSHPVPESYSIGIMISFAQIFGFLLGLALSAICTYSPLYGVAVWVLCAIIASIFSFLVKRKPNMI